MNNRIYILLVALLLVGCSTFPDKLQLDNNTPLISYEDAASKAEQVKGKMLRWGGTIAKVENKPDSTVFEMVYYPLNGYGKPVSGDESMGRFRMSVDGFMDPMVYKVGRLMTFTAQLNGLETGLVGEHEYVFPTAIVNDYYLWKNVNRTNTRGLHIFPHQYWNSGFNNWYYPRHYRRNVFIRGATGNNNQSINPTRAGGAKSYQKPVNIKRVEK